MVNKLWCLFIIFGITYGFIFGDADTINSAILDGAKMGFDMSVKIFPVMALWLGIMNIAKESGLLNKVSRLLSPVISKIFPEIPYGHESVGFIATNMVANMLGLGNAATPFGIKAMKSLQEINGDKETASRSMITFLVINTSGLTIVPTTIISLRMMLGSLNPSDIVIPCIISSFISLVGSIIIDRIMAIRSNRKI
ncbi:MAG: spore maturation protein [Firmicutes bacterium]|nr:spore maturation protein [Bacillota bacterium]